MLEALYSLELAIGHDGDVVSQDVGLLHGVCGHDDDPVPFHAQNQVPNVPPNLRVHTYTNEQTNKHTNKCLL